MGGMSEIQSPLHKKTNIAHICRSVGSASTKPRVRLWTKSNSLTRQKINVRCYQREALDYANTRSPLRKGCFKKLKHTHLILLLPLSYALSAKKDKPHSFRKKASYLKNKIKNIKKRSQKNTRKISYIYHRVIKIGIVLYSLKKEDGAL
ncbi:hypothetical protein MEE_01130 [Bartonella elizabethae F9251 = ATCC 49927]|uniref:Uncharacterized protein n=1 Tax=Bartonella elizabethae F9251 = ATCC 49927 TaxID=1094555 RepID=J1KCS4_BAREL|nr:hypothetical protein MEE_01130 [Bartonella elizabethae F9251 = ATCC 49927]VEJ41692.1 Uncharacterised protein [Bartonella elizabethae]